jgi:hypothetical protein
MDRAIIKLENTEITGATRICGILVSLNKGALEAGHTFKQVLIEGFFPLYYRIDTAKEKIREAAIPTELGPALEITMPCGESINYQTLDDFPGESVPCSCGNPVHWFIKMEVLD